MCQLVSGLMCPNGFLKNKWRLTTDSKVCWSHFLYRNSINGLASMHAQKKSSTPSDKRPDRKLTESYLQRNFMQAAEISFAHFVCVLIQFRFSLWSKRTRSLSIALNGANETYPEQIWPSDVDFYARQMDGSILPAVETYGWETSSRTC